MHEKPAMQSYWCGDSYATWNTEYDNPPPRVDVWEREAERTGLLDADGRPLVRGRAPLGFKLG